MALRNLRYCGVALVLISVAGFSMAGNSSPSPSSTGHRDKNDRNGSNTFYTLWNSSDTKSLWVYYSNQTDGLTCLKDEKINMTFTHIYLKESFKNGSLMHSDVNEWYFNRGPSGTSDNTMAMMNDSRTDNVKKYLMYNNSDSNCAVIKVEIMTENGLPLLATEITNEHRKKANGAYTLTVYYDVSVKDPTKPVPTDCIEKYNQYVTTGNKTIYTSDCQSSEGKTK